MLIDLHYPLFISLENTLTIFFPSPYITSKLVYGSSLYQQTELSGWTLKIQVQVLFCKKDSNSYELKQGAVQLYSFNVIAVSITLITTYNS